MPCGRRGRGLGRADRAGAASAAVRAGRPRHAAHRDGLPAARPGPVAWRSPRCRPASGWAVGWNKPAFWGRDGAARGEGGRPAPDAARPGADRPRHPARAHDGVRGRHAGRRDHQRHVLARPRRSASRWPCSTPPPGSPTGDLVEIDIRGRRAEARIVKPPFVQTVGALSRWRVTYDAGRATGCWPCPAAREVFVENWGHPTLRVRRQDVRRRRPGDGPTMTVKASVEDQAELHRDRAGRLRDGGVRGPLRLGRRSTLADGRPGRAARRSSSRRWRRTAPKKVVTGVRLSARLSPGPACTVVATSTAAPSTSPVMPPNRRTACRTSSSAPRAARRRRRAGPCHGRPGTAQTAATATTTASHGQRTGAGTVPATSAPRPSGRAAGTPRRQASVDAEPPGRAAPRPPRPSGPTGRPARRPGSAGSARSRHDAERADVRLLHDLQRRVAAPVGAERVDGVGQPVQVQAAGEQRAQPRP